MSSPRRRLVALAAAIALVATSQVATACGGSTRSSGAPVLTVVTALWPLAVAARAIGLGNVAVSDPVPAGADPRTWSPDGSARRRIGAASIVLEVGGGFQHGFEAAARANAHTLALVGSASPSHTEVWLDPFLMEGVGQRMAAAFERLDPGATATFRTGLAAWQSDVGAQDASYGSTLSVCTAHRFVAVDPAMAVLGARYDFTVAPLLDTVEPVGLPSSATVAREAAVIRAARTNRVYADTSLPISAFVGALGAADAHVAGTFDSLLVAPASGADYSEALSANLSVLSKALACPDASTS